MTKEQGTIIYEFVRGVTTYHCTCGSAKLRPYRIVDEEGETERSEVYCLGCGARTEHDWEELPTVQDLELSVNGDVDGQPIE